MSFYDDWAECLLNNDDDFDYLEAFLKKKDYTTRILRNGNNDQLAIFSKLLINYDFKKVIDILDESFYSELIPSKIIQFSNFENGTSKLVQLLYNKEEGLSYPEIGRQLVGSEELNAATKYGENHSKFAREFNLVEIGNSKPAMVKVTNFGKCFAFFDENDQKILLKIMGLRDPLIKNLIIKAKKGIVYYVEECNCLSESTKIRRRSNVKKLFEFIFEDENNSIASNIMW